MNKELEQQTKQWLLGRGMWLEQLSSRINVGGESQSPTLLELFTEHAAHLEAQSKPIQPLVGVLRKLRGAIHAGPDTNTGSRAGHVESLVILGLVDEIDAALSSASEDAG